jgi:hypothetical protein
MRPSRIECTQISFPRERFAWWYGRLVRREHLQNKTHAKKSTVQSKTWLRMTRYNPLIVPKVSKGNLRRATKRGLGNPSLNTNSLYLSIARPVRYLTERYRYPPVTTQVTQVHQLFSLEEQNTSPGAEYLTTGSNPSASTLSQ